MTMFLLGLFIGANLGFVVAALLTATRDDARVRRDHHRHFGGPR